MWPHGFSGPAPKGSLEEMYDRVVSFLDGLDPMSLLLALVGVCIVVMLVVALESEEDK